MTIALLLGIAVVIAIGTCAIVALLWPDDDYQDLDHVPEADRAKFIDAWRQR